MRSDIPASTRRCIQCWCVAFALLLVALGGRLFVIQVLLHPALAREAKRLQTVKAGLLGTRGTIYDRTGVPLAFSRICYSIFADPEEIDPSERPSPESRRKARRAAAARLAPVLGQPESEIDALLAEPGRFVWLSRRADDRVVAQVRELCRAREGPDGKKIPGLRGIGFIAEKKRLYPYGELAGQTLGLVRDDHIGGAGIELAYDRALAGLDGYVVAEVDGSSRRRIIPGGRLEQVAPQAGRDVYLTIDVRIQEMAEGALREGVESCNASGGTAIVLDPMTGAVLALANYPSMDPNRYREFPSEAWRNPAVTCVYEPGSTFKLVAACAALQDGGLTADSPVINCTGSKAIGRRTIHCALHHGTRAHGALDLRGVIVKSCNIGAATLALSVGADKFYKTLRALGFTQRTGIGLPCEAMGSVPRPDTWRDIRLANLAFGQGITVTPPQLLAAYTAIAGDGILPPVHIVDRIGQPGKQPVELAYEGRRALRPDTARTMADILGDVVTEGTGQAARLNGFTVAGKTGTAQKPTAEAGYASGKYIGSFVGFAPAEEPRVAILVIMDEPRGSHYGSVVAAPVFCDIARRGLSYLGMPPRLLVQAPDVLR
ncbi:MAG: penicillin-binding protein 2 [Armatimonadota bacterium]|nr:MAG: penicillin-binding protein 2 [Armatimonadota bacterium]